MPRRAKAIIRYDGPALSGHEMDVHQLAPALLGLGELCRVANQSLNSDAAAVKVLVKADVEQKCFQLEIELVQTLYERLTAVLEQELIKDAKEILEWVGILVGGPAAASATLFGLYKFLSTKKPEDSIAVSQPDPGGNVTYRIGGIGNSITVSSAVDQIARDPRSLQSVQRILDPLRQEGYDTLEFECNGSEATLFTRDQARQIISLSDHDLVVERDGELISETKRQ